MFILGIRSIYAKNVASAVKEGDGNGFGTVEIHLSSPRISLSDKIPLIKDNHPSPRTPGVVLNFRPRKLKKIHEKRIEKDFRLFPKDRSQMLNFAYRESTHISRC